MINRAATGIPPSAAFTKVEIQLLDRLIPTKPRKKGEIKSDLKRQNLSHYTTKLARLGGYRARASDPPPGNQVMWRGISRLTDIELGFTLAMEIVGN